MSIQILMIILLVLTSVLSLQTIKVLAQTIENDVDCIALSKTINQDRTNTTDTPQKRVDDLNTYINKCQ